MITVTVSEEPIDPAALLAAFTAGGDVGAVVHFLGIMRAHAQGRALAEMRLEHYPGMCERLLAERAREIASRFGLDSVAVRHRVGRIRPGEVIVWVATAAAHREAAFCGAEALMDYLKTEAPFWKKEVTADGDSWWVAARARDEQARRRWETGGAGGPPAGRSGAGED